MQLTTEQQNIINYDKNCFVMARAGSGKSSTIVQKIKRVKQERPDSKILYITFTVKAAREGMEKLKGVENVHATNYHRLCYNIVAQHKPFFKVPFIDIVGDAYCLTVLKSLFNVERAEAQELFKRVLHLKHEETTLDAMTTNEKHLYVNFHRQLEQRKKFIFADLIQKTNELIVGGNLNKRAASFLTYDYIFLDEQQDNYRGEFNFISNLMGMNPECIVNGVGDLGQSIYSFSGAIPSLCIDFISKFNAKVFNLSSNVRSQAKVLDVGNNVLANMEEFKEFGSLLVATKPPGENIQRIKYPSSQDQYQAVCSEIGRLIDNKGYKYSDFYIIYRLNRSGFGFEKAAIKNKIPFVTGRGSLLESKVISLIIDLVRFSVSYETGTFTDEYLFDVLQHLAAEMEKDVGEVTIKSIHEFSSAWNLFEKMQNVDKLDVGGIGKKREASVKRLAGSLTTFLTMYKKFWAEYEKAEDKNTVIGQYLIDLYERVLTFKFAKNLSQYEINEYDDDFSFFKECLLGFEGALMERVSQFSIDYTSADRDKEDNRVQGLTVHRAKGLENKVVFLIDFNLMPFAKGDENEEKRILYVAVTRPKELLYITSWDMCSYDSYIEELPVVTTKEVLPTYGYNARF